MIVSFQNATMVLSIGDKVAEVPNSGFDNAQQTIHAGLLDDCSMIQVCNNRIRHIKPSGKIELWQTSGLITHASSNARQLVVSLQGGELIYFELDSIGQLSEMEKKLSENDAVCLDVGPIPEGRQRSKFVAIGETDKSVKILSLDPGTYLSRISLQALPGNPQSVCLSEMRSTVFKTEEPELYLHVGLGNGVLIRTAVDPITGALSDSRNRFIGTKPVQLFKAAINGGPAMIALSSRSWICYTYMSKYEATPLSHEAFDYACSFSSKQCPEGIVGICGNSLRIVSPERLGELFNQNIIPLRYTPRKMLVNEQTKQLIILEADNGMLPYKDRVKAKEDLIAKTQDEEYKKLDERLMGYPRAPSGKWASCVRILSPQDLSTIELLEFEENEVALSCAIVNFASRPNQPFLVIGTAKDVTLQPRKCTAAFISLYAFLEGGKKLELYYKMPVEDIPLAFVEFQGQMLAGIGNILRLYDLGKKKLLKKCENKVFFDI
jgi:splicing factor 3B subunit 3